jgi:hypothetical protein
MPIRMVDDDQDPNDNNYNNDNGGGGNSGGGGGNLGGLLGLLPLFLGLFRSKFGIFILVLLGAGYFFLKGCNPSGGITPTSNNNNNSNLKSNDGILDPNVFKKASVYESLEDDQTKNPLPDAVSLLRFAPNPGNQGQQGSCVAWSSAYAARTILESASKGVDPNSTAFSPSFLYNQIGEDGCEGSYIQKAMEFMSQKGALPLTEFPYDDKNCSRQPNGSQEQEAANYKIHGFNRLTTSEDPNGINIRAVKEHLAKDAPVVIGMMVGGTFMQDMLGKKVWQPTAEDHSMSGFGGHAICVIGYDDKIAGGAFQIRNSWGPEWGENGVAYVRYPDFKEFVREAYGLDPLPKAGAALNQPFDCEIGLMAVDKKGKPLNYIALSSGGANTFTSQSVAKNSKFKVEVKNTNECYVYVFGQETDGSSYTLFPYPSKTDATKTAYTPYCGITGYRLFPKSQSMSPDSIGNKDYMAVVVSKQPLNWYSLNQTISKNHGNYAQSVSSALTGSGATLGTMQVSSTGKGNMHFTAPANDKSVAYSIVEINKQ